MPQVFYAPVSSGVVIIYFEWMKLYKVNRVVIKMHTSQADRLSGSICMKLNQT